jgi:hypothetical protein
MGEKKTSRGDKIISFKTNGRPGCPVDVLPTDWLERTMEAHPCLDWSFGPGTWKHLMMGDLMTHYGSFYTGATRQFSNINGQKDWDHQQETEEKVKALQAMNAKCNLPPNTGGEQLEKKHAEEHKARFYNLMARFKAKSSCRTTYNKPE